MKIHCNLTYSKSSSLKILTIFIFLLGFFKVDCQTREYEPIILSGPQIEWEFGSFTPNQVHAYSYDSATGWVHIPFQIDERKITNMEAPYGPSTCGSNGGGQIFNDTLYCDINTHVGADINIYVDQLDELVFMFKDADEKVDHNTINDPQEVINAGLLKRCEVELTDPLNGTKKYIYLYAVNNPGTLSSTHDYVEYQIHNPFPADCDYQIDSSKIITPNYEYGYLSALETTFLKIGNTWDNDLLDRRHLNMYPDDPGYCPKTDYTFSTRHNAYEVNKDGTVRAIRSVMGTHSGYRNVRLEWFYENKHVTLNKHRVHAQVHTDPITGITRYSGIQDIFDFSTEFPNGVSYYNGNLSDNMNGGSHPLTTLSPITSQRIISTSVNDIQLNFLFKLDTDMSPSEYQIYNSYEDLGPATTYRCHGDLQSFGNTGIGLLFNQPISTDPALPFPTLRRLRMYRYNYYFAHNQNILMDLEVVRDNPIIWSLQCAVSHCSNGIQDADETGVDCGGQNCPPCDHCSNGVQDADETGIDCGGQNCPSCDHCSNGIQDADETGVDCGGQNCPPCLSCNLNTIDYEDFQINLGNWTTGNTASRFYANIPPNNYVARINGNGSGSFIEYTFSSDYDEVNITFDYQTMNYTNDLRLEINTGTTWTLLEDFAPSNNMVTNVTSTTFSVQSGDRIRFKGNEATPGIVFLDNILIEACNYPSNRALKDEISNDQQTFNIYPNPSSGRINIEVNQLGYYEVLVFDAVGKIIESKRSNKNITLNLSAPGIYFVRIRNESGIQETRKILITDL